MAEDTVEGEGAVMVMGGIGEVHQGILYSSTAVTLTDPLSWVTVFTDPDRGDMGRTGEAIILIIMEATPIPVMDT